MKRFVLQSMLGVILISVSACKKENNTTPTPTPTPNPTNPVKNRNVRYEVSGNYTGKLTVQHFQAGGGIGTSPDITVPWSKEITYEPNVGGVNLAVSGHTGQPGQTVTIKIYIGGVEKRTASGEVNNNGVISVMAETVLF